MTELARAQALLDTLCEALLAGRYADLAAPGEELERILSALSPGDLTEEELSSLKHGLERNEALTLAARDGLRTAQQDMRESAQKHGGIATYSSDGQPVKVPVEPARPARRA